jgi:O-antigen ligase
MIAKNILYERINYYSLLLISFSLPFGVLFCSYSIAVFVINQILFGDIFDLLKASLKNKLVWLFIGFYFLHLAGLLFTDNFQNGVFDLEKKVALFIFPLLLFPVKIKPEQIASILLSFVTGCFILSLVFLGNATYNYLTTGNWEHFILDYLSNGTGIHRVYASAYLLFSVYILVYIRKTKYFTFRHSGLLFNILSIHFIILIFLLASRTVVFICITSFIVFRIYTILETKKVLTNLVKLSLFILLSGSFLIFNSRINDIMSQVYTDLDKGNSEMNHTGPNQRIEIWKAAGAIIKENIFGVGTGDTEDALYKQYAVNNFKWGMEYKLNAHNQYLQTFIGLGLIGLLALLATFLFPAFIALRKRYYLLLGFIVLFSAACLTESMLCTQKGVVFFAFFNSLLLFHYPEKNH